MQSSICRESEKPPHSVHTATPWGQLDQFRRMRAACTVTEIVPAVKFHAIRHTFASLLVEAGTPLAFVAEALGHAAATRTGIASGQPFVLSAMAVKVEQLPDRTGFLKFASRPGWMRATFVVYELERTAMPFVPESEEHTRLPMTMADLLSS